MDHLRCNKHSVKSLLCENRGQKAWVCPRMFTQLGSWIWLLGCSQCRAGEEEIFQKQTASSIALGWGVGSGKGLEGWRKDEKSVGRGVPR